MSRAEPWPARGAFGQLAGAGREALERQAVAGTLLAPAFVLFTVFVVLPMLEAGWYSFYRWDGFGWPTDWIGARHFLTLLGNAAFPPAAPDTPPVTAVSLFLQPPPPLCPPPLLAPP